MTDPAAHWSPSEVDAAAPSWPPPELAAHLARRRTCEECRDWASHRGTDGPHHELCSKAGAP